MRPWRRPPLFFGSIPASALMATISEAEKGEGGFAVVAGFEPSPWQEYGAPPPTRPLGVDALRRRTLARWRNHCASAGWLRPRGALAEAAAVPAVVARSPMTLPGGQCRGAGQRGGATRGGPEHLLPLGVRCEAGQVSAAAGGGGKEGVALRRGGGASGVFLCKCVLRLSCTLRAAHRATPQKVHGLRARPTLRA